MAGDAWNNRDPSMGNLFRADMTRPSLGVCFADRLMRVTSAVRAVPQARGVVRAFDALRPCYGETKRKARSVPGVRLKE